MDTKPHLDMGAVITLDTAAGSVFGMGIGQALVTATALELGI